jgi:AcrR family transcriptional regulator
MTDSSGKLQARKQQLVRDAIWDAAIDLFVANGFDSVTVDDIAQSAGVSPRTFFRYFSSKGDLMGQGIVTYREQLAEAIRARPRRESHFEVMRHSVLQIAEMVAGHPRTRSVIAVATKSPGAREAQLAHRPQLEEFVARAFAQRLRNSRQNDLRARLLAGLTLTALDVAIRYWYEHGEEDIRKTAENVFSMLGELTG